MEQVLPNPGDSSIKRDSLLAVLFSLALHVGVVVVLGWAESVPPQGPEELAASTLTGTTFEVDLGSLPGESSGASQTFAISTPSPPPEAARPVPTNVEPTAATQDSELSAEPLAPAPVIPKPPSKAPIPSEAPLQPSPSASNRASPSTLPNDAPSGAPSSEARYGAAEGATRVSLTRAFIKTLPLAAKLFPGWLELALGAQKPVLVELRLDADGQLRAIEILSGDPKRLTAQSVQRNQVFLRSAHFANDEKQPVAVLFSVRAEVSMKAPSDELDSAEKVVALGQRFDAARPSEPPTGAYLTYGSGRHVEFEVSVVPTPR